MVRFPEHDLTGQLVLHLVLQQDYSLNFENLLISGIHFPDQFLRKHAKKSNLLSVLLILDSVEQRFHLRPRPDRREDWRGVCGREARARDGVRCKTHVIKTNLDRGQEGEIAIIRLSRIAQQLYASFR